MRERERERVLKPKEYYGGGEETRESRITQRRVKHRGKERVIDQGTISPNLLGGKLLKKLIFFALE